MINLIPPYAKKRLLFEYWVRVTSVWLMVWSVALLVSACIVLPAYVLISSQVDVYAESAKIASEKVASYENVSDQLVQASVQAQQIVAVKESMFSTYSALFKELQGAGVEITELNMNQVDGVMEPITINGIAADRQTLASFRDRILAEPIVEEVELPISNLARDSDIKFTIQVTLRNETDV